MHRYFAVIFLAWYSLTAAYLLDYNKAKSDERKIVVISLDGFRADYMTIYNYLLGNFSKIAQHVHAEYVQPSFPSLTFPNHFTMATGIYPENHGIVHNSFVDPEISSHFKKSLNATFWEAVEPIWITAVRQQIKTAVFMWPGSVIQFGNWTPTYYPVHYNESITWANRVDIVLDHLADDGVKLAMMYFHEPDKTAHVHGPKSHEMEKTLRKLNENIGYLLNALQEKKLTNITDVIIASDHGLTEISNERVIYLNELFGQESMTDYLDSKHDIYSHLKIDAIVYGSVVHLWPQEGRLQALYDKLYHAHPHLDVYLKSNMPLHWHYNQSQRIPPLVAVANPGWQVALYRETFQNSFLRVMRGMHGYDVLCPDMRATFMAMGPSFKSNVRLPPFINVNLYSLIAHLTGVRPHPSNGSLTVFLPALKKWNSKRFLTPSKNGAGPVATSPIVLAVTLIFVDINSRFTL